MAYLKRWFATSPMAATHVCPIALSTWTLRSFEPTRATDKTRNRPNHLLSLSGNITVCRKAHCFFTFGANMALLDTDEIIYKRQYSDEGSLTVEGVGERVLPYAWIPKDIDLTVTLLESPSTPSCAPTPHTAVRYSTIGTCVIVSYDVPQLTEIKWKIT